MKKRNLAIKIFSASIGWLLLSMAFPCFGAEGTIFHTQGLINPGGNLKAGYLFINEMRVHIQQATQIMDSRGKPITIAELKPKKWVYMEVERDSTQKIIRAKKIYLLPHYIKPGEKSNFSFMK